MQKKIDQTDLKIKVIEKTGSTLKRALHKTSITEKTECSNDECQICKTSKRKGMCRKEGVTYEIVCDEYRERYIGDVAPFPTEQVMPSFVIHSFILVRAWY